MTTSLRKSLTLKLEDERHYSLRSRGILFLDDQIDEGSFSKFCRDLIYLATGGSTFDQPTDYNVKKPIWVVLNSPGGDVIYGLGIYDCIKMIVERGQMVSILSVGMAGSMAAVVLQAGTRRLALPNTQFLIHQVSETVLFAREEVNQSEDRVAELKRINGILMGLIAERVGIDPDELLKRTHKKDVWLNCTSALELGQKGLIDETIKEFPF